MRFGAHAFVWASDWSRQNATRVIEGAAQAGLDFVEIPLLRPHEFDVAWTKGMLEKHGLEATFSLGLPVDASLPGQPDRAKTFLFKVLQVIHQMNSDLLTGVIYGTLGQLPGHPPTPQELEIVAKTIKQVAREAATLGLRLGIEPVNRYETHLINLGSQGLDLIKAIGEPNVFLHLDTYHMNIEEKGFEGPIVQAGNKLQYIHLSESDRGTPGAGNVQWDKVFSGLAAIGYQGDLVMESFVALNPDIARATCIWRDVAGDPAILVREGLRFLRGKAIEHGLFHA